ncbi:MAG TPA: hypothetical protein VMV77_08825 [Bacteroidales bacterium]|nr:hypothetical protein [Bacteroidales bacterium]
MTKFEYINTNILTPAGIREQVKLGILPASIIRHFELYCRYDYYRKQGYKKYMAVGFISEDYRLHDVTILRIIKNMEKEV